MRGDDDGLTLVELLVVVVIIGVLAAVAVPSLIQHRKKGYRAAATADMKSAATAVETFASAHDGSYALLDGADQDSAALAAEGYNRSHWIELEVVASDHEYCLRGRHEEFASSLFVFRSGTGVVEVGDPDVVDCA